jgi:hypothetical protein
MVNTDREYMALTAYLRLLENKGADVENLKRRKAFLVQLIPLLADQPQDVELFQGLTDDVLTRAPKAAWPFLINVALEYYHFWVNDIKAIAALHASGAYNVSPTVAPVPSEDLQTLWKNLDNEQFSVTEKWPLKAYAAALREEGAEQEVVETRSRLVKLLLVHLRDVEVRDGASYRIAVHGLLPLFGLKESREIFLAVVREFFYFWIGDPDAIDHIVMNAPVSPGRGGKNTT